MNYNEQILYDFSNESPSKIALFGLAVLAMIAFGMVMHYFKLDYPKRSSRFMKIWAFFLSFIGLTTVLASTYSYLHLRNAYINKTYKIVEGHVKNLRLIPYEKGNQTFEINSIQFENHVTKGLLEYYFGERNALQDGMPLKIYYTGEEHKRILYVEVEPAISSNDSVISK